MSAHNFWVENSIPRINAVIVSTAALSIAGLVTAESVSAAGLESSVYAPSQWDVINPGKVEFDLPLNAISLGAPLSSASNTAAADGILSFNYNMALFVGNSAKVTVGNTTEILNPVPDGPVNTSGFRSYPVSLGDPISFQVNTGGDDSGAFQVTDFDAPIPTPAMLPGLIGMGLAFWRKKTADQHVGDGGKQEAANEV